MRPTNYKLILDFRNIVSTVNLDCKLDLKAIALQARNAEYNPKVFEYKFLIHIGESLMCYLF